MTRDQSYQRHLGGGAEHWERRGAFQLFLLRQLGLKPAHAVLDTGCGPLRGGQHLIDYLDSGSYVGVDDSADFIHAAGQIVREQEHLERKAPLLARVDDFDIASITSRTFDYVLAFSVLNHCTARQRQAFFARMPSALARDARIVITHAAWLNDSMPQDALRVDRRLEVAGDLSVGLRMKDWGWPGPAGLFPIVQLTLR